MPTLVSRRMEFESRSGLLLALRSYTPKYYFFSLTSKTLKDKKRKVTDAEIYPPLMAFFRLEPGVLLSRSYNQHQQVITIVLSYLDYDDDDDTANNNNNNNNNVIVGTNIGSFCYCQRGLVFVF